ncbi:MAG: thioredoxin family protein [Desulfurococcales archaeon]|nr:thioredoxin family protein [Desulfurococcales archaeon]
MTESLYVEVSHEMEHGIYIYNGKGWTRISGIKDVPDGASILYFSNARCPACKEFNKTWNDMTKELQEKVSLVVVLCGWFEEDCSSREAAKLFDTMAVFGTPTIVSVCKKNGEIVSVSVHPGFKSPEELRDIVQRHLEKCK